MDNHTLLEPKLPKTLLRKPYSGDARKMSLSKNQIKPHEQSGRKAGLARNAHSASTNYFNGLRELNNFDFYSRPESEFEKLKERVHQLKLIKESFAEQLSQEMDDKILTQKESQKKSRRRNRRG